MSFPATVYQILIASPSDVAEERSTLRSLIFDWTSMNAAGDGTVFLPVLWETHSSPRMGERPQEIINRQLVKSCDALIGVFWTRIGTPTGVADSGTIEEIQEFIAMNKPVLLYFSNKPVAPQSIDQAQYAKLKEFKAMCQQQGLIDSYSTMDEFREKVQRHLSKLPSDLPKPVARLSQAGGELDQSSMEEDDELSSAVKEAVLRHEVDWNAERDSDPHGTGDGKAILDSLGNSMLDFRVALAGRVTNDVLEEIQNVIQGAKGLQRHQLYMDGGKSFREFWEMGDGLIRAAKHVAEKVQPSVPS